MIHHRKYTIIGRVQGVFFRASTCNKAIELGLTGFVLNQTNGSVYAEAEGTTDQLNIFKKWLEHGPRFANVDEVYEEEGDLKSFPTFEISY